VEQFTVGKLAARVGASPDTLRYYERIGLLPKAERSASGYRLYGDDAVGRLRFIKGAQQLGLSLEEIGELLSIRERGLCPCGHTRQLLEQRLSRLDAELAELTHLRGEIRRMVDELPVQPGAGCSTSFIPLTETRHSTTEKTSECC
jgi:DNA-binding transcriptional MerR regulator